MYNLYVFEINNKTLIFNSIGEAVFIRLYKASNENNITTKKKQYALLYAGMNI